MVGDPRDRTAYGIAFAGLGFALVVLVIGICWISTERGSTSEWTVERAPGCEQCSSTTITHDTTPKEIPTGLWVSLVALGGVLVGALIPFPLPSWISSRRTGWLTALFLCFLAGIVAVGVLSSNSLKGCAVAAVLLGLLVPSPASEE